ncbi:MAG: hypothetical protein ACYTGV_07145, partial [Planctomycetota bacterium]
KLIKTAFEHQRDNRCFSFVEVLSTCPTNWGLSPNEATDWVDEVMMPYYPLGILKEPGEVDKAEKPEKPKKAGKKAKSRKAGKK